MKINLNVLKAFIAAALIIIPSYSAIANTLPKVALIKKMQGGGLILYIRHASTETDYADQTKADVNDGSTQRVLSEKGWHEAINIGKAFQVNNIPVGDVVTSEYFRAWQTAWLAFGKYKKDANLNFLPFEKYNTIQLKKMENRTKPFLSIIPADGKNTIIVAHDDTFEAATGLYPEPMGVCFIIKPHGEGKFTILGKITPENW